MFTCQLPKSIPAPKFKLFDRVTVEGEEVVIVGISYIEFNEALLTSAPRSGWEYKLSWIYERPESDILCNYEPTSWFHEARLKPAINQPEEEV